MPMARRDAAGAHRVSAVTAVSTASANAAASKPLAGVMERGEVQHEAGRRPRLSLPDRRAGRAVPQQQHAVQPLGQRHLQAGAQGALGDRPDPGLGSRRERHRALAGCQFGQRGGRADRPRPRAA